MSILPKVASQQYPLALTSGHPDIKLRPFTISEQKILLHALEMGDNELILSAIDQLITQCSNGEADIEKLSVLDVEQIVVKMRSISVSNISELVYICQNEVDNKLLNIEQINYNPEAKEIFGAGVCEARIPANIDLSAIKVKENKRDKVIKLTEDIAIKMKDLSYSDYKRVGKLSDETESASLNLACQVDLVIHKDNLITRDDITEVELLEWLAELIGSDYNKLQSWCNAAPQLEHSFLLTCPDCGKEEVIVLNGLNDFLV